MSGMRAKITLCLFILSLLFFVPGFIFAHPLDITYMDIHMFHDANNNPLPKNVLTAEIYIPWVEASYLVEKSDKVASPEAKALVNYHAPYTSYIENKIRVVNNTHECSPLFGLIPEMEENEILFGRGILIPVKYTCNDDLKKVRVTNSLFVEVFPAQRNVVNIFNGPDMALQGSMLTAQIHEFIIDADKIESQPSEITSQKKPKLLDSLTRKYLQTNNSSLLIAVGIVFLLGMLHTLEAGHSKTILASFLIHRKASIKHGMLFVSVFTLTHIADIVILGLLLLITNSFIDVFSRLSYLQTFSLYTLLFISVYMLFTNIGHYIKHKWGFSHHHDHNHTHEHITDQYDLKKQLFVGFVAGLSPCLFGWSIFMVILSTKNIWSIFPVILAFGAGIFIALSMVVLLVGKLRMKIIDKNEWIAELSPIISSLILVIFSVVSLL